MCVGIMSRRHLRNSGFMGKFVEIYYLENGKYILEQSYILQNDKELEHYNAETVISLRAFPHIQMTLEEIFDGMD